MSDEELDDLFRRSAERYDPPFDAEAWKAMEHKLDNRQGHRKGMKRFLPLLLALLLSIGTVWLLPNRPASPTEKAGLSGADAGTQHNKALSHENNGEVATLPGPHPEPARHPAPQKGPGTVAPANTVTGSGPAPEAKHKAAPVKPLGTIDAEIKHPGPGMASAPKTVPARVAVGVPSPDVATETAMKRAAQPETPDSTHQKQNVKAPVFLRDITLSLVLAPDVTTVRFRNHDAVSLNAGLLVSLPLTDRFSLITGVVGANKLYSTEAKEYEPYPGYWDGKSLPRDIEAKCQVLDIPLNLQYHLLKRGKNIVSVQAGVSSYLMLKERYIYTYQHAGHGPYSKTWEVRGRNKHWFGVQNLSVGYTRRLSPAFSVGAEPFVKIPLSDIGAGRVKLTSAGIFFTAGYTLSR